MDDILRAQVSKNYIFRNLPGDYDHKVHYVPDVAEVGPFV